MNHDIDAIFLDHGNTLRIVVKDEAFQAQARQQLATLVGAQEPPDAFCERLEERFKACKDRAKEIMLEASERELWTRWMLPEWPPEEIAPLAGSLTRLWRDRSGRRVPLYFDVRGFYFLTRTVYFTDAVVAHLGGRPFLGFEQKQRRFEGYQSLGYKEFKAANAEVDQAFIESVHTLVASQGTPVVLAIAGPTAAGKTEIVARLRRSFEGAGKRVTSIEMDNFLTDRDQREEKGIYTLGKATIHFELFKGGLEAICRGRKITIPRYDFIYGTSSHDLDGNLKPGGVPIEIDPADIIFIEGNFPFLLEEVTHLIGIKAVYLTDDAIRMKRKWKRDIDYRKKYEPTYFRNRYFRGQFLMAQKCYRPQMQVCDLVVDTTGAAIWATPEIAGILSKGS